MILRPNGSEQAQCLAVIDLSRLQVAAQFPKSLATVYRQPLPIVFVSTAATAVVDDGVKIKLPTLTLQFLFGSLLFQGCVNGCAGLC